MSLELCITMCYCFTLHPPFLVKDVINFGSFVLCVEGRLWIHAASKVPEEATIKAMEDFYKEIYAVNGITEIKFPKHYPVSRLLGILVFIVVCFSPW